MILELSSFDLTTAPSTLMVATAGLWESLPRLCRGGLPVGRLLLVADTLEKESVLDAFQKVATPEERLPPGVLAYRIEYENYLQRMVQAVRYIRAYLVIHPNLDADGMIGLLGAYGLRAQELDHELPRPFDAARSGWDHLKDAGGTLYGMLVSAAEQGQAVLHPRLLHNLFAQEFPVYAALQFYTYPQAEVMRLLNEKSSMALYGAGKTVDSIREAEQAQAGVRAISDAISNGETLHTFRLYVLIPAADRRELDNRLEIARGALGLRMERVYAPEKIAPRLFSADALDETDGTPLTTAGAALLAGSALSYRRRTAVQGVMLGVDRNQAPVILDFFDDRHPSYNMVVLGQTGAGKTFACLLLMLRHLLLGTRLIILDPQGNIRLDFLGDDVCQRSVVGTEAASVNVLDIVYDEIGAQVEMAIAMLRLLGVHGDRPLERALLDEGLVGLYLPVWGQGEPPLISDLHRWMEGRVGRAQSAAVRDAADSLTLALQAYVSGSRAAMFGRRTNMDFRLEHAVNVFDVSNLPQQGLGGNLRSALLSILVANINQGIRRRRRDGDRAPILFFVDEMGILMRDAVVANYISSEYKTSRARLVGMLVADQDLHSLLGPRDEKGLHHGIPILANAANTLIFNQRDSERVMIQEHFPALPQTLVDALPALPRGTCVAQFADGDLLVVNIVPSRLDQVVLSSRLQDRMLAMKIVEQIRKEVEA